MVVEDEGIVAMDIKFKLSEMGYEVPGDVKAVRFNVVQMGSAEHVDGDSNGDGDVDQDDLDVWLENYDGFVGNSQLLQIINIWNPVG